MPYIPPHLRPGYVPKPVVANVAPTRRGVHFPTNALNATNMTTNVIATTRKYSPRRNNSMAATRSVLKRTVRLSPNNRPPVVPSHRLEDQPPKFREMLMRRSTTKRSSTKKGRSRRRSTKRHGRRRGH